MGHGMFFGPAKDSTIFLFLRDRQRQTRMGVASKFSDRSIPGFRGVFVATYSIGVRAYRCLALGVGALFMMSAFENISRRVGEFVDLLVFSRNLIMAVSRVRAREDMGFKKSLPRIQRQLMNVVMARFEEIEFLSQCSFCFRHHRTIS